jgi:hypothetical protein
VTTAGKNGDQKEYVQEVLVAPEPTFGAGRRLCGGDPRADAVTGELRNRAMFLYRGIMEDMIPHRSCSTERLAMDTVRAIRRLGRPAGEPTTGASGSPDVVELEDGNFAVVGWDVTRTIDLSLLPGVHRAAGERVVRIDRQVPLRPKRDIPDE